MRVFIHLFALLLSILIARSDLKAQAVKQKETCAWIETILRSAVLKFSDTRQSLLRSYEETNEGGSYFYQEYGSSFRWPGTANNYLLYTTDEYEKYQSIVLICPFELTRSKEQAYANLKKYYAELTPCTVSPVAGQKAYLKGTAPIIAKSIGFQKIMEGSFNIQGAKRKLAILLGIREHKGSYSTEMRVSVQLNADEVMLKKCNELQEIVAQLSNDFSGHYGKLTYTKDYDMGNMITETRRYEANTRFPGNHGAYIENSKTKKNGKLGLDTWSWNGWYSNYLYDEAVIRYKKLYEQLQGCEIKSPAGRTVTLSADYKAPDKEKRTFIDFIVKSELESFFISINFEKEDDRYFVELRVSLHKKLF